jgi:hypothetical protein
MKIFSLQWMKCDQDPVQAQDPRIFEDAEDSDDEIFEDAVESVESIPTDTGRHYKFMCNQMVGGKRQTRNSKLSKSIVDACATDKIHVTGAFGDNGEVWNCYHEAQVIKPGDIAHMYYGDLEKGTSKHFVGKVLSSYKNFSSDFKLDNFPEVKRVWPYPPTDKNIIFSRVDWNEIPMTVEDEYMIKNPGKNGFKVQGTILRIK